ncbi:FAS1 domain-containing protein [Xylaria nigripes]|nr:FAS1 domain-containing protein [Xylaria nigripes]
MRYTNLLPLVTAIAIAFVIPDDETAQQISLGNEKPAEKTPQDWWNSLHSTVEETVDAISQGTHRLVDELSEINLPSSVLDHDGILGAARFDDEGHDITTTLTIYQAIHASNHSKKFAELVDDFPDIVQLLNSTDKNVTVFVPTDRAFEHIPKHGHKPHKKFLNKVIEYHILRGDHPAGRLFASHTVPTILNNEKLGDRPQRLRISVSLLGLRINFYSKVVRPNMFAKNGVIHAVDSILVPPPPARRLISLFPSRFSTLELALEKTGVLHQFKRCIEDGDGDGDSDDDGNGNGDSDSDGDIHKHKEKPCKRRNTTGLTIFAPTNFAFLKLGPGANAFLFNTKKGRHYLRAILQYHIVVNETLYSDAFYGKKDEDDENMGHKNDENGHFHVDLPTLLEDKSLSVDVAHWYRLVNIRINGYTNVAVEDGIAQNGVVQVLNSVLIPPRRPRDGGAWTEADGEISVEELVERLEPYVENEKKLGDEGEDAEVWSEL